MRNLTKSIAVMAILAPASAYALGIGDIKLHSTLNQNLDAEIALLVSADENISEINVRLASPDKFDEAGVPWIYFLSKIKFKLVATANGSSVIKLTSSEALREPFLDFLLEVSWAKGNLYREFTVLVDPPVAYTQPIIPIINKVVQVPTQPRNELIETVADSVDPIVQYGPIRTYDSLWKIAKETNRYSDVSIEQMMIAIYEANPRAFYKENVNALMADKILDIPAREVILRVSKREALAEFRRQNNTWNGRVSAKIKKHLINSEKIERSTQLELEAPVEEEITKATVISASETVIDNANEEPVENRELIPNNEIVALLARLEKLEKNQLMMQEMLALKDEQLAAIQNQKNINITAPLIDTTETVKVETAEKTVPSQKTPQVSEAKTKVVDEKVAKLKLKPKLVEEPESGFFSDLLTPILSIVAVIILGLLGLMWSRKRQFENEIDTDTESMFATASEISLPETSDDSVVPMMDDTSSYDVGTVGESSFLSEFTPSDFDAFDTDQNEVDPISEADVYLAYGRYQQAEDIMRQALLDQPEKDECKLKLLEIFYADENKTAFEEFAAELVSSGKNNDQEFWEKVAEMGSVMAPDSSLFLSQPTADLNGTGIAENIESLANENDIPEQLFDNKNNESEDASVDTLDFDLSIFEESEGSTDKENASDLDFDLSVFDEDEESTEKEEVNDLDFDLSVFDENETEETGSEFDLPDDDDSSQDVEGIELQSTDVGANTSNDQVDDEIQQLGVGIETIDTIDFDEKTDPYFGETDPEIEDSSSDAGNGVDEELESFDFSLDNESPDATTLKTSEAATELDDIEGFDFDFDTEIETTASPSEALDMGVSDLTDMDELETKIDLAKAYIDMGDVDAAMGIVDEVMEKGNEEQKATAQEILDQLK